MRLVDYAVVHELVHLRHPGHCRDYWQALGRVMPDYEMTPGRSARAEHSVDLVAFVPLGPWLNSDVYRGCSSEGGRGGV